MDLFKNSTTFAPLLNRIGVGKNNETVDTLSFKTISANQATANKEWVIIDAQDVVLGRLASHVAQLMRGKHKTNFTPHCDCGDNVIIVNCAGVRFTGKKLTQKQYVSHTGYPGGQRFATAAVKMAKNPGWVIQEAVKGMLPKNKLSHQLMGNLHVYAGNTHPHTAQKPKEYKIS